MTRMKSLLILLIVVMMIVFTIKVFAYEVQDASSANQTLCSEYTPLSASDADLQFKDFCGFDTCTYVSGNWEVDCSENCTIDTNTDVSGNNITFDGVGVINISANITNWNVGRIQNACIVRQDNTGGLRQ